MPPAFLKTTCKLLRIVVPSGTFYLVTLAFKPGEKGHPTKQSAVGTIHLISNLNNRKIRCIEK